MAKNPFTNRIGGEADWLNSCSPYRMIEYIVQSTTRTLERYQADSRLFRLFACAVARMVIERQQTTHVDLLKCVKKGEDYACGITDPRALADARHYVNVTYPEPPAGISVLGRDLTIEACVSPERFDPFSPVTLTCGQRYAIPPGVRGEEYFDPVIAIIRDIWGNPFHQFPVKVVKGWQLWQDTTIARMARTMYDNRDYASLPILGDALEEAGCSDPTIIEHCRGPGPHYLGCWVLDMLTVGTTHDVTSPIL